MITSLQQTGITPSPAVPLRAGTPAASSEAAVPGDRVEVSGGASAPAAPASKPAPADVSPAVATAATPGPVGLALRAVIAGPPGAGKTTHGTNIAKAYGVPEISMGSLLRDEVAAGTELGKQAEPYMKTGDLVPIEIVEPIIAHRLSQPDAQKGFVLDGIPRRIEDAHLLERITEKMGLDPIPMIFLDVPDSEIVGRVENRRVCDDNHVWDLKAHPPAHEGVCDIDGKPLHRREDDDPKIVQHRLDVYHEETEPVLGYFRDRGMLHPVDGVGTIEAVSARALSVAQQLARPEH